MHSLRNLLLQAGFSRLGVAEFFAGVIVLAGVIFIFSWNLIGIFGFSVSLVLISFAASVEFLENRANHRANKIARLAPSLANAFATAYQSGVGLKDSVADLESYGPGPLKKVFGTLLDELDRGGEVDNALIQAKNKIGEAGCNRVFEAVIAVEKFGSTGAAAEFSRLSEQLRIDLKLRSELAAKQAWVSGSAKSALLAPWLVVLLLAARPEAKAFYISNLGLGVLLAGALFTLIAYRFITLTGRLTRPVMVI